MARDEKMLETLDKIEKVIGPPTAKAVAVPDLHQLCLMYQQIKPLLQDLLKLIEKIPVYGSTIAAVIRFLMTIADVVCHVT
jgi:hypothetical protein